MFNFNKKTLAVTFFWGVGMIGNTISWIFSLLANQSLSLSEFGDFTLIMTFHYLIAMVATALLITTNRYTAIYKKNYIQMPNIQFLGIYSLITSISIFLIYILTSSVWMKFFSVDFNFFIILISGFIFMLILPLNWFRGVLQGFEKYVFVGITILSEMLFRVIIAMLGFMNIIDPFVSFISALPISMLVGLLFSLKYSKNVKKYLQVFNNNGFTQRIEIGKFFLNTITVGLGVILLSSIDILLVKHFFKPQQAGIYAILSLIGKVIFFFSQSFNGVMVPLVSSKLGNKVGHRQVFMITAGLTIASALFISAFFIFFPQFSLKYLLGERYLLISNYILKYCLAISMISLTTAITTYQLLMKHFWFQIIIFIAIALEILIISINHNSLINIIDTVLVVSMFVNVVAVGNIFFSFDKT